MVYNFDEIIDRKNTNAMNVEGFRSYIFHAGPEATFAFKDDEFVRMWVADMEFAVAPAIRDAIKERLDKQILGYTGVFDSAYYPAFQTWCQKMYGWSFPKEELLYSPGVVPAIIQLVETLVGADEKVITHVPAYSQFKKATDYNHVELVCDPLKKEDGRYVFDFDSFAQKAADPKVKLVILCNPHNPTGRVWTEEELKRFAEIVEANDLWLVSDEIHCDLLRQGKRHIPMGKIMPQYPKLITCMSASKTFNVAGLMHSHIIIRDEGLRNTFRERDKLGGCLNPLSIAAHQAAYEKGGEWLAQLKSYLDGNFRLVKELLAENLPGIKFDVPEATYLAWVDFTPYLSDVEDLPLFFANEAGVLLEGGDSLFVGNAKGFVRLNLAMPRALLEEGMARICRAVKAHMA